MQPHFYHFSPSLNSNLGDISKAIKISNQESTTHSISIHSGYFGAIIAISVQQYGSAVAAVFAQNNVVTKTLITGVQDTLDAVDFQISNGNLIMTGTQKIKYSMIINQL